MLWQEHKSVACSGLGAVGVDSSRSILLCVKERKGGGVQGDSVGIYDHILENDFKQENDC